MASLADIGSWITDHEQLLSGLAAAIALIGVVFSAGAMGLRAVVGRRAAKAATEVDAPSAVPAAQADSSEPLLAVLAFDDLSGDPALQYFSDGISEEIIQRLSRGAKLRVMGRLSSFQFRGERKVEAASALRCTHVLDGSVRRADGRLRITAHLTDSRSRTTLWSERFDRALADVFAIEDEIADQIARALDRTFASVSKRPLDPAVYDLYLRSAPRSYAPDELRTSVGLLELVCERAPDFIEGWARLAYLRAWLQYYLPFRERPAAAARVAIEAGKALARDPESVDALTAQVFVLPAFGRFADVDAAVERLRRSQGTGDGRRYIGYMLRTMGRIRESLEETERAYRLDSLDPMMGNLVALARMAAGRVDEAVPVYEELVERVPAMSFPVANLLRAQALRGDWGAVDRLLALAEKRELRELSEGLAFIRALRDPSAANVATYRSTLEAHFEKTGCADIARLVYAAHLGLVDDAYRIADHARLGPKGSADDVMGPDGYRTSLLFQVGMPALRSDPRFPRLCARLGLVEFWRSSGKWPDCADEVPYDFRAACEKVRDVPTDAFGGSG